MNWKLGVVIMLLLVLLVFTLQNYESVKVRFLFWEFQTSGSILIFASLFIGIVTGLIVSVIRRD